MQTFSFESTNIPPVSFLLIFPVLWCVICLLVSSAGWTQLREFAAPKIFVGTEFILTSAMIGAIRYGGCLTVIIAADGLYLAPFFLFRPFHPPLLIPWQFLRQSKIRRGFGAQEIAFEVLFIDQEVERISFVNAALNEAILNNLSAPPCS